MSLWKRLKRVNKITARDFSYAGTDIPVDMMNRISHQEAQKGLQKRLDNVFKAGYIFWHDMYKKRLEKYKELKNSLIEVNPNHESDNPFGLTTEENKVMKEIYTDLFKDE
ncbi:hypothetical protein LCGC14_0224220 [marine sediment metagenome]|uniref:Uncharacterized protein n=1 Tax=marine sediment metagenome TaxID=412755 RepID=A0A0F9UGR1_9ZZZZ